MEHWRPELSSEERAFFDSATAVRSDQSRWPRRLEDLLMGETSARWLLVWTVVPVLIGAWILLAPPRMLSREMSWDLMLGYAGAWHLQAGHAPHVDYHDPLGSLFYRLTQLGFLIAGTNARAFLVGQTIFLGFAFTAALVAASRRLAPMAAAIFVIYTSLLVLLPANVGDLVNAYSFAMSYNRWSWSVLTTLCLILFVPPRGDRRAPWLDAALAGALLLVLFNLKITFAVAGLVAVVLALVAAPHVRAAWRTWALVLVVVFVNAVAPYNHAYLSDIGQGLRAGHARASLQIQFTRALDNKAEYALYGVGIVMMLWLWQRRLASSQSVVLAVGTLVIGMFALSQNAQQSHIALGVVLACLIYDALRSEQRARPATARTPIVVALAAVMFWPLLSITSMAMTLAGYHRAVQRDATLLTVDETNLRTLAVPFDKHEVDEALATIDLSYAPLGITREPPLEHQLSQEQYIRTLMEAVSFFQSGQRGQPKIWIVDQVNPLPFLLGYPPPRGEQLWTRQALRPIPASEILRDVDIVMIPKFPTYAQVTTFALTAYYDYLSTHFPVREQTPSWTILRRQADDVSAVGTQR